MNNFLKIFLVWFGIIFLIINSSVSFANDSTGNIINRAKSIASKIEQNQLFTNVISNGGLISLPVGIKKEIAGVNYTVCIDSITVKPDGAYLTAYMVFELPSNGQELVFMGTNIPISKNGGIDGIARLELVKNFDIPFGKTTLRFLGEFKNTFVEWDCNGFVSMGIDAEAIFSKEHLLKENLDGSINNTEKVKGRFTTVINDWTDLLVTISIDRFQVKGLKDFSFEVNQASFDFSDINNPLNINFPSNYTSNLPPGMESLWRGFHLQQLTVKLPASFTKNDNSRAEIIVQDMLIDKYGFTGIIAAKNLIPEGNMGGWKYSLDSIAIQIIANQLTAGGFGGEIVLPIAKDSSRLKYTGTIGLDDEYGFIIQSLDTMESNLWKAKLVLSPLSTVELTYNKIEKKFKPKATLHGNLSLDLKLSQNNPSDDSKVQAKGINFQSLVLQTESPFVQIKSASLGSSGDQKLSKFPINISSVSISTDSNDINLGIGISLNLVGNSNGNGFSAGGVVTITSELNITNKFQQVKFKKISVGALSLNVDQGSFKLDGSIINFNSDPTYGKGFKGTIKAEFKVGKKGIEVGASALFGNINGMRYWNADAMATFPSFPVFPGFNISGFGGGAYYRMKQTSAASHPLGTTVSGITYVPDSNTFLGVKAMVKFEGTQKNAYNGDLALEFSFNNSGGLNHISLFGNAEFMTPPFLTDASDLLAKTKKLTDLNNTASTLSLGVMDNKMADFNANIANLEKPGKITASAFVQYDFTNKTLHATFDAYVNMAGGMVVGSGTGGLAGNATMHFEQNSWYIHIGKSVPGSYIGLKMLNTVQTQSYFMVGDNIPPLPPFPSQVRAIASNIARPATNPADLALGKGFATGASISLASSGKFSIFKYSVSAGIGFDMLVKHTPGVSCANTSSFRGMNGWYAQAQAYAYFNGSVGVQVKTKWKTYDFNILSLSAAAALQAKLPNPSWFSGTIAGSYSVLGGLKSGSFSKSVTFGKTCAVVVNTVTQDSLEVRIIDSIYSNSPNRDTASIFAKITAKLNIAANTEEQIEVMENSVVNRYTYKVELTTFKVEEVGNSNVLVGTSSWDTANKVVTFTPSQFMKAYTNYKVTAEVTFKKKNSSGGWTNFLLDGTLVKEDLTYTFTTGGASEIIVKENIQYCYPQFNQTNFYQSEHNKGFVKLNQSQSDIFTSVDNSSSRDPLGEAFLISTPVFLVNWIANNGTIYTANNLSYNTSLNQLEYTIPSSLPNNEAFHLKFLKIYNSDTTEILDYYVRTSNYNTVKAKLQAYQYSTGWRYPLQPLVHEVGVTITGPELFDKAELQGTASQNKLIEMETMLDSTLWFTQYMDSLLYQGYPFGGISINNRNVNIVGVPPLKSGLIRQPNYTYEITESQLKNKSYSGNSGTAALVFNTAIYAAYDYTSLYNQIANIYSYSPSSVTPRMSYVLNTPFTRVQQGNYMMNMKYFLPNGIKTSDNRITIFNPIQ